MLLKLEQEMNNLNNLPSGVTGISNDRHYFSLTDFRQFGPIYVKGDVTEAYRT